MQPIISTCSKPSYKIIHNNDYINLKHETYGTALSGLVLAQPTLRSQERKNPWTNQQFKKVSRLQCLFKTTMISLHSLVQTSCNSLNIHAFNNHRQKSSCFASMPHEAFVCARVDSLLPTLLSF